MKKFIKSLYGKTLAALLIASIFAFNSASAANIVTSSGVWYRSGANMLLNPSTLEVGSSTVPIAKIWATDLDVAGSLTVGGTVGAGGINFPDDIAAEFGTSTDASILYETADANANALLFSMPAGGAVNVPVAVFGDDTALNLDLGLFNGITDPSIAVLSNDATKAIRAYHDGTNGVITATSGAVSFPVNISHTPTLSTTTAGLTQTYATSGAPAQIIGQSMTLSAGTTSSITTALNFENLTANNATAWAFDTTYGTRPFGARGINGIARGASTNGINVGALLSAKAGLLNIGVFSSTTVDKASSVNVAVVGVSRNTEGTGTEIGGYFSFHPQTNTVPVWGASAALIADNDSSTSPIFSARDGAVQVFGIADLGLVTVAPTAATTGSPTGFTYTQPAHTGLTASTENTSFYLNFSATKTFTGGSISANNEMKISNPTYAFDGISTITRARTLQLAGGPIAGTDATITESTALQLPTWASNAVNSYNLVITPAGLLASTGDVTEIAGFRIAAAGGSGINLSDQTANITNIYGQKIDKITFKSTTNVRTVTGKLASLYIDGPITAGTNVTFAVPTYSLFVGEGPSRFDGTIVGRQGTDIASANDATLTATGNYFDVTGTTQMNTLSVPGAIQAGTEITLQFDDAVLVKHATAGTGAQFQLGAASDFSATAGDILKLTYDGTYWREVSRTAI